MQGKYILSADVARLEDGCIHVTLKTYRNWVDYNVMCANNSEGIVVRIDTPTPDYCKYYLIPIKGFKCINHLIYDNQDGNYVNILCVPRTKLVRREGECVQPKEVEEAKLF